MNYDTIIVGAGIIGSSTAYHLQRLSPKMKILLLDRNSKVAVGNTSKSAALYRNLFSSKTSQVLSTSSISFYETIAEKIALKNIGYFWMLSEKDWQKSAKGLEKLDSTSDNFEILSSDEIPFDLNVSLESSSKFEKIYKIIFGHRCGSLSAVNLARYYANQFVALGGTISLNTDIRKISLSEKEHYFPPWSDVKITSIMDQNGTTYHADNYLFATGAWTNDLLIPLGIASHIYPQKRQMFTLKLTDTTQITGNTEQKFPIIILPTGGVYIKPLLKNKILTVGCANELGNPFQIDSYPPDAEEEYFQYAIKPVLEHYFPKLENFRLFSKWAGYYAYYWPDKNPIIEKITNIQWVSGTSGSGIMKADAIGRIAAARNLSLKKIELYDGSIFDVNTLSLKKRKVDIEELVI